MTTVVSLLVIGRLMTDHYPTSEFYSDNKRLFFTFTEKAYESMHGMDRKIMTRHGWTYDKENDCWFTRTD